MTSALAVMVITCVALGDEAVRLSVDGSTKHEIVIADGASVEVQAAAAELSMFLELVCPKPGALYYDWIDLNRASLTRAPKRILVGRSKALDELRLSIDWDALGDEGFVIRTAGPHLVIAGGPRRGTINGVYTFLEDIVGIRWFTPDVTHIPHKPDLTIGPLNMQHVPVFDVRTMNSGVACDVDWAARQRINFPWGVGIARRLGDGARIQWGLIANDPKMVGCGHYAVTESHTLGHDMLLPVSEFDENPDYFALVDGKRDAHAQPCLTNADVASVVVANARRWLESDPTATVISISLGDFARFCGCTRCKTTINEYGRSGYVLRFVNQVAAELEEHHPRVLVSTLAYHWFTRTPPTKPIDVHPNVVIRFAPIYASGQQAYDEGAYNLAQRVYEHLVEWVRIAPRVWVWSYFLAESDLHPFATFNCLSRNFKIFRDVGVKGFTLQADEGYKNMAGGMTELQGYLLAKLMWNPDYDVQAGIEEFCRGCYGAAAPHVISYVRQINDIKTYDATLSAKRKHSNFEPLKVDRMVELDALFDEAERAVAADAETLERVRFVRLGLQYAIISHAPQEASIRRKALRDFFPVARRAAIPTLHCKTTGKRERLSQFERHVLTSVRID
jgi:hypothetical protein